MTGTHDCPATGCNRQVPNHMLMCGPHWGRVPAQLRRAVYAAWQRGAGAGTPAHLQAMEDAIAAVDGREPRELFG